MVLVFGGTTEGKDLLKLLNQDEVSYIYSTKTKVDVNVNDLSQYSYGAMEVIDIENTIIKNKVTLVVDTSHPFAINLHKNIVKACVQQNINSIRVDRPSLPQTKHKLVFYAKDFEEALSFINRIAPKTLLALTGVQSIPKLAPYWTNHQTFFRILPKETSIKLAEQYNFSKNNLIFSHPGKSVDEEIDLIIKLNANAIITKESGKYGGLENKLLAALKMQVPIIVVERPTIKGYGQTFTDINNLVPYFNQKIAG